MFACSREAAALGVVRQQPIAEVKGLAAGHTGVTVLPHDPDADQEALLLWAERCERFSPLVGVDDAPASDSLLLDVTATARLFGGEAALAQKAVDTFVRRRLQVRATVADTPAAAWAIAHFHGAFFIQRSPFLWIPPGETLGALRLLPIESLRLPERTVSLLHELGVDLAGQLAMLPREELSSRFGPELLRRWDQATGVQPEPIRAVRTRPEFTAGWEAEQPTRRRETIHAALQQVVERLTCDLLAAGRGATRVECRFDCLSTGALRFTIGLFRPTVDAQHLLGLLHLKLERERLAGPVTGIEAAVLATGPLVHRQMSLFSTGSADSGDGPPEYELEQLVERLSSRLGRQAVMSVCLLADAQPERAWRGGPPVGRLRRKRAKETPAAELPCRPLRLFSRPLALRAVPAMRVHVDDSQFHDEALCARLACVHFEGEKHRLVGSWGPERIETGWWRGRQIARDYYRVETAAGRRLWLFRRLDDGRWFAHGAFD